MEQSFIHMFYHNKRKSCDCDYGSGCKWSDASGVTLLRNVRGNRNELDYELDPPHTKSLASMNLPIHGITLVNSSEAFLN